MLTLSDAELDIVLNLAQPLEPIMRDAFLQALARHVVSIRLVSRGTFGWGYEYFCAGNLRRW
jgi:hypothetical protein